jgi:hypothetical protein
MTDTLNRPTRTVPRPPRRPVAEEPARSPLALGAAAALWAAVVGLFCVVAPVLLVWATDSRSGVGWGEATRTAGRFWLVAHGASLDVPGGRYALTPLGLLLVPVALVVRFTSSAAADLRGSSARPAARLAAAATAAYGVLALLVAVACTGPDVHVSPVQSLLAGLVVGAVGAGIGILRPGRLWRVTWHRLSPRTRRLTGATAAATALLLGAGALLVGGSLAVHGSRAAGLTAASDPGALGGVALLLACLALVPNAVVWGVAWLAGPGFAVGAGTGVGPFGHELGPVPALPLLAALPAGGVPEWVAVLVLALPLLAGAVAGRLLTAELGDDCASAGRTVAEAAAVGPAVGAVFLVLAWLSGGAVGGERLVEVGPSPWAVALALTATVAVGSVVGALLRRARVLG